MESFNQQESGWGQNWLRTSQATKGVIFIALSRLLLLLPLLLSYAVQPHRSMRVTVITRTLVHKINVAKDDS